MELREVGNRAIHIGKLPLRRTLGHPNEGIADFDVRRTPAAWASKSLVTQSR